ncbi:DUF6159 family protein [Rhodohalobacter sp.]|uniref:DUF6159 family protein n=1 Tax=Rhodohalobacter sp. TaxID=1974210 RepID=UPI002ACE05ED|nr:DUF6159 family protein [Rhodohalobacter sp.]MDZ7755880.1 DUF6159 family protein [Rhodohalobacter sp.]
MNRFSATWSLMKSSLTILLEDKRMLLFPVFSGVCTLLVGFTFVIPLLFTGGLSSIGIFESLSDTMMFFTLFMFYYLNYFIIIFFNSGAILYAIKHIRGEEPTFGEVFNELRNRLAHLLGWTAIAATVGIIINTIENQSDFIGKIVAGLIGLSWTVTSFLVLPVLVIERKGPIESLKESAGMLKKSWGEQLIGHFSFGLIFAILLIGAAAITIPLFMLGEIFIFIGFAVLILFGLILGVFQWILQSIFMATLYLYVREDRLPGSFSKTQIDQAVR